MSLSNEYATTVYFDSSSLAYQNIKGNYENIIQFLIKNKFAYSKKRNVWLMSYSEAADNNLLPFVSSTHKFAIGKPPI